MSKIGVQQFIEIVQEMAAREGIDPDLACAIASVESSWNPWAVRFEPAWKYTLTPEIFGERLGITLLTEKSMQSHSWGLMQVMGSVARELGFRGPLQMLCDPRTGATFGCKKLRSFLDKYGSEKDAIASYNAGGPRRYEGMYVNQGYVDKVMQTLTEMRMFADMK